MAHDRQKLEQAFCAFNRMSAELETSYRDLERTVLELHAELRQARVERVQQAIEPERLAARLRNLLEVLPGGVVVLDGAQIVRDFNPAAAEMLGLPLRELSWDEVCKRAFLSASRFGGEVTLASGRQISISQRALGAEPGSILLVTDLTEATLVRELLERHKRLSAIGEMAAALAHQIRTPLSAALLYASQVANPGLAEGERTRFAERTRTCLHDLERLVNDMLAFTRGGGGSVETFSLSALLEQVAQCLEPRLRDGARLTIRTLAPELKLRGNSQALAGALLNLANNAFENGSTDIAVVIEARTGVTGGAEIRVSDDGPGIAPELRERVFEPFFTTRARGTGLGLAVVKTVVTAHGGDVALEDSPRGASFLIRLPSVDATSVVKMARAS